jgi:DNA-binding PadR family transcriptional regulator
MSGAHSTADREERTAHDLTAFQQTILTVLSEDSRYGLAVKRELENTMATRSTTAGSIRTSTSWSSVI